MNILYLTQVFEVGVDTGSERDFFFCRYAVGLGHSVEVITSNVDYKKASPKIIGQSGAIVRVVEGVKIHYVYSYSNIRGSFLKRFYYYFTYLIPTIIKSFKVKKIDVIYAVSTPLLVGLLGYVIARLRRVPYIFELTDIWPDAAVACGVVRNKFIIWLAKRLEMFCYKHAAHIVVLSNGMRTNLIEKGIKSEKISLITNGVDFSLFDIKKNERDVIRKQLNFGNRFVSMYLGAHGAYNSLDTIIEAASYLKEDPNYLFVLIGDGDEKKRLQDKVFNYGLQNVLFLKPIPRNESAALLSAADFFLLPNRKGNFFLGNLPNKLFDFLASSHPIIVAGEGETADLVRAANCGEIVGAEDSLAMANQLKRLSELPDEERIAMGMRGREFVEDNFDRNILSKKFIEIISKYALSEA